MVFFCAAPSMADSRPNFVIVLTDDQGYGDLGCYGHPHLHTPHLDRLAEQGLRLTDCHSPAANCSPARTGLLTGRTPNRAGIYSWIPMFSPMHLRESEITVAGLLHEAGYTTAVTGKWHLAGQFNLDSQGLSRAQLHGFVGNNDLSVKRHCGGLGHYHCSHRRLLTSPKCRSPDARIKSYCRASAAIHRSFSGIIRPFCRNSFLILPNSWAVPAFPSSIAIRSANAASLWQFSTTRTDFRAP